MTLRVGIHLPQLGRAAAPDLIIDVAREAERLGFADAWASDHVALPVALDGVPAFFPEPIPVLSLAAAHTTRIGLGTSVLIAAYRNPMHLAKQWATLDWVAPGRTILGVGAGFLKEEFEACQVPFEGRGARLDGWIEDWRTLWTGGTVRGARMKPIPAQPIPVWVGGSSKGALARAARNQGWHPTWAPPARFSELLAQLRAEIERQGRDPAAVVISMHWEVRAGQAPAATGYWSRHGDGFGEREVLTGSPDQMGERLREYEALGLQHVLLTPQGRSRAEWMEQLAMLAEAAL